jgi:2-methylcitrate dehydratase PrpD
MGSSTETAWSEWLVKAISRPISQKDRERAALQVVDWMGCSHLGQSTELGDSLRRWGSRQPAGSIWVCGYTGLYAPDAARWNANLGSVHEMDDVHREAVVHAGDIVIPAALAISQRETASAEALLNAVVIGYETAILLGLLSGREHYDHWYSTATAGVFASAMSSAHLLGLTASETQSALGLAGMQAAGVWQCRLEPGYSKQFSAGQSAHSGIVAAEMALSGVTGPLAILEGELGWLKATGVSLDVTRAEEILKPGIEYPWRIHEVSFKPWSACRHVHPAIECGLELHAQGIRPEEIEHIQLETYEVAMLFADNPFPATESEGRFSLQHCLAWALFRGTFDLDATKPEALRDSGCQRLSARMAVCLGDEENAAYPTSFGAKVTVRTFDGRTRSSKVTNVLGDPESPISEERLFRKAHSMIRYGGFTDAYADAVMNHLLELSSTRSLSLLWRLLMDRH